LRMSGAHSRLPLMTVIELGALCFGIVVGWITSRALRRSTSNSLTDIATVIGSVAGAAITGIWQPNTNAFGYYCIGLFIGFYFYLAVAVLTAHKSAHGDWIGTEAVKTSAAEPATSAATSPATSSTGSTPATQAAPATQPAT